MKTSHCPYCPRGVWWVLTRNRRRMPLDTVPDAGGEWIPVKGRAWEPWELRLAGEPWSDFATAPAYRNHITTCKNWPRGEPTRRRSAVYLPDLACHWCGTVESSVRHVTPDLDLCRGCRTSPPATLPAAVSHLKLTRGREAVNADAPNDGPERGAT